VVLAQSGDSLVRHLIQNHLFPIWTTLGLDRSYIAAAEKFLISSQSNTGKRPAHLTLVKLPGVCHIAAGGAAETALSLCAGWLLIYAAANLMDKVADAEPLAPGSPAGRTTLGVSVATVYYMTSMLIFHRLGAAGGAPASQAVETFLQDCLRMADGQHADLTTGELTLADWRQIAERKSGVFFGGVCRLAAALAGAAQPAQDGFASLGYDLGVALQILDDLEDCNSRAERPAISAKSALIRSFPVLYLREVDPAAFAWLLEDSGGGWREQLERKGAFIFSAAEVNLSKRRIETKTMQLFNGETSQNIMRQMLAELF
jgi:geranylgeranyl pyrophosphate synthase